MVGSLMSIVGNDVGSTAKYDLLALGEVVYFIEIILQAFDFLNFEFNSIHQLALVACLRTVLYLLQSIQRTFHLFSTARGKMPAIGLAN